MNVDEVLKQSTDFGPAVFLLVLTWMFLLLCGTIVLKKGWELATKNSDRAETARQQQVAVMTNIAESNRIIAAMTQETAKQNESIKDAIVELKDQNSRHIRIARKILEAMKEVVPSDKHRAIQLLEEARQQLDG